MLTQAWTPLRYHRLQSQAWRTTKRYVNIAAGRGSGKTEIARRRVVRMLPVKKPWSDPMYGYGLPTFAQAKRVAWKNLVRLIPRDWIRRESVSEMVIETVFGSSLYVIGMDKPQRAEGVQWDGFVLDESSDQRPGVFDLTLSPALTHRQGWCWRIGVPKRAGIGARDFKSTFDRGLTGTDPDLISFAWSSEDILAPADLRFARENLDEKDYNEQYRASWETLSGLVFFAYDDVLNTTDSVAYRPDLPLLIGSDFNVSPMAWVVCQDVGGQLNVLDELFIRNTNTRQTLDALFKKYGRHEAGFFFYGDATGQARKTAASESDYIQIKNDARFKNARVYYPRANPQRANRFAACNAMFCNALGVRRVKVHTRCKNLRNDLMHRSYEPGTNEVDDHGDIGHITDALGYIIYWRYPIKLRPSEIVPTVVT